MAVCVGEAAVVGEEAEMDDVVDGMDGMDVMVELVDLVDLVDLVGVEFYFLQCFYVQRSPTTTTRH